MPDIEEFPLPGVGVRYELTTRSGKRVGIVSHRSGRREILVQDPRDPDSFQRMLELTQEEAQTFSEALVASRIVKQFAELQQRIHGLSIDWLPVRDDSPYVDRTIGDTRMRTRTGVSIVAIVRGDDAFPAPEPDFTLQAGDYLVVVGTSRGVEQVVQVMHAG